MDELSSDQLFKASVGHARPVAMPTSKPRFQWILWWRNHNTHQVLYSYRPRTITYEYNYHAHKQAQVSMDLVMMESQHASGPYKLLLTHIH